jgi:hypothetical protein
VILHRVGLALVEASVVPTVEIHTHRIDVNGLTNQRIMDATSR